MTIGFAVLGAGIFAIEAHLPAIKALGSKATLVAVYSRSNKSAQAVADAAEDILSTRPSIYSDESPKNNLDALLARTDIHAVSVVLPILAQPAVIIRSLKAGKHVLSEKPIAKDVTTALELINEVEKTYKPKGLVWRVAENFEAEPGFQLASEFIKGGRIGELQTFGLRQNGLVDTSGKYYKTPWRTVPDYQGGFLLDGGVHSVAVLRTILPSPITRISALASLNKDYLAPQDTLHALVQTESGAHGTFELSFSTPSSAQAAPNGTIFTGSQGTLWTYWTGGKIVLELKTLAFDDHGAVEDIDEQRFEETGRGVDEEFASFVNAIKGRDDGLGSPGGALEDVKFIEAGLKSNGAVIVLTDMK